METSRHDEKAIAFFGFWTVTGLYIDGWAHLSNKPETFFTPWHLVLYSGVGTAIAYFAIRDFVQGRRKGERPNPLSLDGPDRFVVAGLVLFIICAIGDFAWHEIFGIEVDLEALFSPTHMGLFAGGLLMLSFPIRTAWARAGDHAPSRGEFFPTTVAFTLVAAVSMFFLQFFAAYRWAGTFHQQGSQEFLDIAVFGSVMVTNAVMFGTVLFALRRWSPPFGTFTFLYAVVTIELTGLNGFFAKLNIVSSALTGLVIDVLVVRMGLGPENRRGVRIFSAFMPVIAWGLWFGGLYLQEGVHWAAELWTGTIIFAVLESVALGLLAFPPGTPSEPLELGRSDVPPAQLVDEPIERTHQLES